MKERNVLGERERSKQGRSSRLNGAMVQVTLPRLPKFPRSSESGSGPDGDEDGERKAAWSGSANQQAQESAREGRVGDGE